MRLGIFSAVALATVSTMSTVAFAQDEKKSAWSGETELGYSYESGNTNEENLNFRQKIVYDAKPWLNTFIVTGKNSMTEVTVTNGGVTTTEDQRTAEAYYVTEKLDRFISERTYAFGRLTWEKDRFNGFEHQASEVVGFGRVLVANDALSLKIELGAGARQDELDDNLLLADGSDDPESGTTSKEAIGYFSNELVWKISEPAELGQTFTIEAGDENTISRFTAYVKSQLLSSVSMKVSYETKYTEKVPAQSEKRDDMLLVSLLYSF
jgi:putative salt-induced outer membrane protein